MFKPWLRFDWIFNLTALAKEQTECIKYLHSVTDTVVTEKIAEYKQKNNKPGDKKDKNGK